MKEEKSCKPLQVWTSIIRASLLEGPQIGSWNLMCISVAENNIYVLSIHPPSINYFFKWEKYLLFALVLSE